MASEHRQGTSFSRVLKPCDPKAHESQRISHDTDVKSLSEYSPEPQLCEESRIRFGSMFKSIEKEVNDVSTRVCDEFTKVCEPVFMTVGPWNGD